MPLQGGIRQQLRRDREVAEGANDDEELAEPPPGKLKTHRAGGRNTENISIGSFLKEMYLIGRVSAPEFQEEKAFIEKIKAFIENTRYCPRPEAIYLYWQGKLLEDGYTLARGP